MPNTASQLTAKHPHDHVRDVAVDSQDAFNAYFRDDEPAAARVPPASRSARMRFEDASTPAVVLGCFRHGGLAIVRSLGGLGVPVYAVHADR
jgi:hypothetical protein